MEPKNKYIVILIFLFFFCSTFILGLYEYNEELEKEVEQRDKTILELIKNDSIYSSKTKEYSEVITEYVDKCSFYLGDRKIATKDIISIINILNNENNQLKDSLYILLQNLKNNSNLEERAVTELLKYADSIHTYKRIIELTERDFGITYNVTYNGNYKFFSRNPSKADSALILFPHYKDKISYDSISKSWNISILRERELIPTQKPKKSK